MNEAVSSIDNKPIFILVILLFTFVTANIIFTLYIYHSLKDKQGPQGAQGPKGDTCMPHEYIINDMGNNYDANS